LEGDDPGGRAFALILRPHRGAFTQIMYPHPGNLPTFVKNNIMPGGQPGRGGSALLELTDAVQKRKTYPRENNAKLPEV